MELYKIAARLIPAETASKNDTNITVEIVRFSPQAKICQRQPHQSIEHIKQTVSGARSSGI